MIFVDLFQLRTVQNVRTKDYKAIEKLSIFLLISSSCDVVTLKRRTEELNGAGVKRRYGTRSED